MKTNIFYKVAAVTNSSPKLGEVPQAEESVRTSATSALTDSLGASATPPNLGGESRYSIRKASVLGTLCSVLLISSCTHDEIIPPTPLAPQGTKTVTVDFQLPEGKPGFEVQSTDDRVQSTDNRGQSTDNGVQSTDYR